MFGIDKRLIVPATRRWIVIGIAASLALYLAIGRAVDGMIRGTDPLPELAPWIAALLTLRLALGWLHRWSQHRASSMTKLSVRDAVYRHALELGPAVLDRRRTGELVNIAVDGMEWIELFYGVYFVQFVVGMATPLVLCLFIGAIDPLVGAALLVSVPLTPLFLGMLARNFRAASRRYAEVNDEQSAQFLDSLQGMPTLKAFNLGKARGREIRASTEAQRIETMRLLKVNQSMILFVDFGFALGTTLVLTITALWRFQAGALTPGEVVALVLAGTEFSKPLTLIGQFFFAGAIGRELAKKIVAFLSETPAILDPPGARTPAMKRNPTLRLEDVSVTFASTGRKAVDGLSLELRPGETVALVGPSGAGKTTVANLILRMLAPGGGTIRVDSERVDDVPADWVRAHVALVPQDPYLFHGTVAENLRLARVDASDDELAAACRAANIYEHIASLPQGLQTVVGERGLTLSGGQAQRLAIARALLKDAPIVVLDEPTSQIDPETEEVIHQALERLMRGRTVLLIAHRLSTVARADRIVVMDAGRVLESGTHHELLARDGVYARMLAHVPVAAGGVA